jgi:hypothetical protein
MASIDETLLEDDKPHYTEHRPVLCGSFNMSNSEIPFFQAILPLKSVVDELDLVENIPSDLRAQWKLEELFQREIDWERVETDLVNGYLRRPNKLKFFSTLTVALLPKQESGVLAAVYGDTPNPPVGIPGAEPPRWQTIDIGGVQIVKAAGGSSGQIRWDPKRIFAATIDGQHRLAALKKLSSAGNLSSKVLDTKISVMFLVLDERAGFTLGPNLTDKDENPILTVVREVFIDLNMNAKTVARARQILLSDQNIEARCLREVIATRIGTDEPGRLPLGLIHWQHNESAKFNIGEKTGPFITTVELLNAIIGDVLDIKYPKDPLDEAQVRRFVKSVEESLSVSKFIGQHALRFQGMPPLLAYVEENYLKEGYETPFANLTSPYIRACAESFAAVWRPIFLDVLTKFQPYERFIESARAAGAIDGDIAYFLVQPERAQKAQAAEWGEERPARLDQPLQQLHKLKADDWPFYAVFQKGLFRATKIAFQHYDILPEQGATTFSEAWLAFLNKLADDKQFKVKQKVGDTLLWAGIALNPSSATVNWSESAVQRIASMIVLWWYFHSYRLKQPSLFLKKIGSAQANPKFPQGKELVTSVRRGLRTAVRQGTEDMEEKEIDEKVEKRLRELLLVVRHTAATDAADEAVAAIPSSDSDAAAPSDADEGEEALELPEAAGGKT